MWMILPNPGVPRAWLWSRVSFLYLWHRSVWQTSIEFTSCLFMQNFSWSRLIWLANILLWAWCLTNHILSIYICKVFVLFLRLLSHFSWGAAAVFCLYCFLIPQTYIILVYSPYWCSAVDGYLLIQEYLLTYKDSCCLVQVLKSAGNSAYIVLYDVFSIVPSQPIIEVHSLFSFWERMLADQLSFPCPAIAATRPLSLALQDLPAVYLWWSLPSSKADIPGHVIIFESCIPAWGLHTSFYWWINIWCWCWLWSLFPRYFLVWQCPLHTPQFLQSCLKSY